jgi:hypothetical protein
MCLPKHVPSGNALNICPTYAQATPAASTMSTSSIPKLHFVLLLHQKQNLPTVTSMIRLRKAAAAVSVRHAFDSPARSGLGGCGRGGPNGSLGLPLKLVRYFCIAARMRRSRSVMGAWPRSADSSPIVSCARWRSRNLAWRRASSTSLRLCARRLYRGCVSPFRPSSSAQCETTKRMPAARIAGHGGGFECHRKLPTRCAIVSPYAGGQG